MTSIRSRFSLLLLGLLAWATTACLPEKQNEAKNAQMEQSAQAATYGASPMWAKSANIYEVNVRQYTPEGTFAAFAEHLPRLDEMGVDILWFMPIFPISEEKRKGSLGSPYAVADYTATNPKLGDMATFRKVVQKAHELGMYVILDWVPNHTGWDHPWIKEHPDWYTKGQNGKITDPINYEAGEPWNWTDVADLNYDNPDMRLEMISELRWWLQEVGIDGYRMDVAHGVPYDFWAQCSDSLRKTRPDLFLLAEAEDDTLLNEQWFAMDYAWSFHHLINDLAIHESSLPDSVYAKKDTTRQVTANDLMAWYQEDRGQVKHGYHMHFITNHDENAWAGPVPARMGDAADALAVLAFTFDGMPLIYSGQEAGLDRRLAFFEKDTIDWQDVPRQPFYTRLLTLKHDHEALWNGQMGARAQRLTTANDEAILAYTREKNGDRVIVVLNLSDQPQKVLVPTPGMQGRYQDVMMGKSITVEVKIERNMPPWGYLVLATEG